MRARIRCSAVSAVALALLLVACGEHDPTAPVSADADARKPRETTTLAVSAVDPAWGQPGQIGLSVHVFGSGYEPGATASWERNGITEPKITVNSTAYVSSTELVANITIASDADIDFYDVAVTSKGKKGIGTELFEVTQATAIEGAGVMRGVNNDGEATGRSTVFWSPSGGLEQVALSGSGWGISDDGLTLVGTEGDGSTIGSRPVVWTRGASGWVTLPLPLSTGTAGNARGVASDAAGAALIITGVETTRLKGNKYRREPRVWLRSGAGWTSVPLPGLAGSTEGQTNAVTATGLVVGNTPSGATVWEPDGGGRWTATAIGPAGSNAAGVNAAGTLVVGNSGGAAAYWTRSAPGWSGPLALPGGCALGNDVDEDGRILVSLCPVTDRGTTSAVAVPPYTLEGLIYLGGLGSAADGARVTAMSPDGRWIVGDAATNGGAVGAYWRLEY